MAEPISAIGAAVLPGILTQAAEAGVGFCLIPNGLCGDTGGNSLMWEYVIGREINDSKW